VTSPAAGRGSYSLAGFGPIRHISTLSITTPQYRVPDRPNVLRNALPLHPVGPERLAEAAARFAPRLTHLPRPYVTVNIGGTSGPYAFGPRAADRLVRDAVALAKVRGASLLVSSSARTPACAIDAFAAQHEVPMDLYRWRRGDSDNPYLGYLAMADEVIVTADSISMLSEAYATGKPVHMFDTGAGRFGMRHDMAVAAGEVAAAQALVRQDHDRRDMAPGALALPGADAVGVAASDSRYQPDASAAGAVRAGWSGSVIRRRRDRRSRPAICSVRWPGSGI